MSNLETWKSMWAVLTLFLIPVGGGIPGGVLLAQSRHLAWPVMTILYFISDVILACVFEPLMRIAIAGGKKSAFWAKFREALKRSTQRTVSGYGTRMSPLALILVAFGVDPMTGRVTAAAAGHGFLTGWALSIAGDMMFFALMMASTLWLHDVLGDGTRATVATLVLMMAVPYFLRRFRVGPGARPGAATSRSKSPDSANKGERPA